MGQAPLAREVQRVTIEIKGGPKKKEWEAFKRDVAATLKKYKSVKARIKEIHYIRKTLKRG